MECNFNLTLNKWPNSIKKFKIKLNNYKYQLNNLPNCIEYLELPDYYELSIDKFQIKLQIVKCDIYYKLLNVLYLNI